MHDAGLDIPSELDQPLVDAMFRARAAATPESQGSLAGQTVAFMAPDAEARFEQNWASLQNALHKEIPALLDARQAETFFNYQAQLKDIQLSGLQVARTMLDQQNTNLPAPPAAPALPRK